jgi:hypothetical protein
MAEARPSCVEEEDEAFSAGRTPTVCIISVTYDEHPGADLAWASPGFSLKKMEGLPMISACLRISGLGIHSVKRGRRDGVPIGPVARQGRRSGV